MTGGFTAPEIHSQRGAWVSTDELVRQAIHLAEEYQLLSENLTLPLVDTPHIY